MAKPGIFLILGIFLINGLDSRVVKKPQAPANFGFVVPVSDFLVKFKTSIETIQYSFIIKMKEGEWDVILEEFNSIFEHFTTLNFFTQDEEFKSKMLAMMSTGFDNQKAFESSTNDIIKFKDESYTFVNTTPCQRTLLTYDKEDLERGVQTLKTKLDQIDTNWDISVVKTDAVKQSIIFSFISSYNVFFAAIEQFTSVLLSSLERLSDNQFPQEIMRTNKTCGTSNIVKETEGELYDILDCQGSKTGYHCTTVVTQPIQLTKLTRVHLVNYRGLELAGPSKAWIMVRDPTTEVFKWAKCTDMETAHPTCITQEVGEPCRSSLSANLIEDSIMHCNFTYTEEPVSFVQVKEGGILIQEANSVSSGQTAVVTTPPFIIFSPETVIIAREGEEIAIIPPVKIENLVIVESSLTEEDLLLLESTHKWEGFFENLDGEDYVNIGLAAFQLILTPLTIYGLICIGRNRKRLSHLATAVHGPDKKEIYKKNYSKVRTK